MTWVARLYGASRGVSGDSVGGVVTFLCKHCGKTIRKGQNTDLWLHEDGQWRCYPSTHAELSTNVYEEDLNDQDLAQRSEDGRKGLVGGYDDQFQNRYLDDSDFVQEEAGGDPW